MRLIKTKLPVALATLSGVLTVFGGKWSNVDQPAVLDQVEH
jgi:hypothetical protein